jgi:general secretion pathway protein I
MNRAAARRAASGFTLIEVLVALTIVAVTLGAGIKAAGALTGNTQRLADVTAAQWCADNQLSGLRLSGLTPPIGDSDFTCVQLGQSYNVKLVARPTPNPLFIRVDAQVGDAAGQPIINLSTVLRK